MSELLQMFRGYGGGGFPGVAPQHHIPAARAAPAQPNQEHLANLEAMGFPRAIAEEALVRCNNNLQAAADMLLGGGH